MPSFFIRNFLGEPWPGGHPTPWGFGKDWRRSFRRLLQTQVCWASFHSPINGIYGICWLRQYRHSASQCDNPTFCGRRLFLAGCIRQGKTVGSHRPAQHIQTDRKLLVPVWQGQHHRNDTDGHRGSQTWRNGRSEMLLHQRTKRLFYSQRPHHRQRPWR